PTRDRLVEGVYVGGRDEAVGQLIDAFEKVVATQPIHDRLRQQHIRDWRTAVDGKLVTPQEVKLLRAADEAVAAVIQVDDFAPEELTGKAVAARPRRAAATNGAKPPAADRKLETVSGPKP
ncbi:MAG: acyl-CoA dehydrogenase domain-containing protein, partial [Phenylobacterium sp.]